MLIARKTAIAACAYAAMTTVLMAQQTGTVIGRTPGSAVNRGIIATKVIPPKATCDAPAEATQGSDAPVVPEILFSRDFGNLVCVRHTDGRTEQFHSELPPGIPSPDGTEVAYWIPEKSELHVASKGQPTDAVVDTLPGEKLRGMVWSAKGHALSYLVVQSASTEIHAIDLDTGKRRVFTGRFVAAASSRDPEHVVALTPDGVERLAMSGGQRELLAKLKYPASVESSHSGALLGILADAPASEANLAPDAKASSDPAAEDDGPDCTGAAFFLVVHDTLTKQLLDVPFPKGFDTVVDFSFSPDDRAVAVTFGVVGCDYPGERAQIFVVSLPDLALTPVSPQDRLSVQPKWTPDGKVLVYSDYVGSDSPLVAFDLHTHKVKRLTNPGQYFGPDTWLAWR